jgi:hypothetical protein
MGGYIGLVFVQRLSKHIPAAMVMYATGEVGVIYVVCAEKLKRRELGQPVSRALQGRQKRDGTIVELNSAWVAGTRTWAHEAEESPLLEAIPGNGWWRHSRLEKA